MKQYEFMTISCFDAPFARDVGIDPRLADADNHLSQRSKKSLTGLATL
jgi:hypothetical protein